MDEKPVVPFDICGVEDGGEGEGGGDRLFDTRSDLFPISDAVIQV